MKLHGFYCFYFLYGISTVCGHRFAIFERLHWELFKLSGTLSLGELNMTCFFFNHPRVILGDWTSLVSKARCFLKLIKSRIDIKRPRTFARCTNKRQHCKGALEVKQVQSLAQIPSTSSTTSMAEIIILTRIF